MSFQSVSSKALTSFPTVRAQTAGRKGEGRGVKRAAEQKRVVEES